MTQYSTNANFSADAVSTQATADSTDGNESNITGYTAITVDVWGHQQTWTIQTNGDLGGKYCEFDNTDTTYRNRLLGTNDLSIATTTEFDVLLRFRIPGTIADADGLTFFCDGGVDNGYGIRLTSGGDAQLWYQTSSNWWSAVGGSITPTAGALSGNTWYWLRVHRTDSAGSYKWSWAIDTTPPTTWDLGDGGSGGTADSNQTTGKVGVGSLPHTNEPDFDWFSCADSGDSAPSPPSFPYHSVKQQRKDIKTLLTM